MTDNMELDHRLAQSLGKSEVDALAMWAAESRDNFGRLWSAVGSDVRLISANALWAMTHLPASAGPWVAPLRDAMIDRLLTESDISKKRMLLKMLRTQEYDADRIRTDFLDFCLSRINEEREPYAIRCGCIYAAFKMCRHYPELLAELKQLLDLLSFQSLSPGLACAMRHTLTAIRRHEMSTRTLSKPQNH